MAKKGRYSKRNFGLFGYIFIVGFALVLSLLAFAVLKKQSPIRILKSIKMPSLGSDDSETAKLSKKQLRTLVLEQDSIIQALEQKIDQYGYEYVLSKGRVNVRESTLNLRNEPSADGAVRLKIRDSSEVLIIYYHPQVDTIEGNIGLWAKIKYNKIEGWAWGNYISPVE